MGTPRNLAARLLAAVLRLAPPESREWASAMLAELDFIDGDWPALFWALGCAAAIARHSATNWRSWFSNTKHPREEKMSSTGKKTVGVLSGAGLALLLAFAGMGLVEFLGFMFPAAGIQHLQWPHFLGAIVIPEIVFVVSAILLWRKRPPVALGILLMGAAIGVHVAVHFATR
jgi:hypothetical protein